MLFSTDIESLFCLCIFSILERFFLQNKDRLFDAQIKKVSEFEKKLKYKKKLMWKLHLRAKQNAAITNMWHTWLQNWKERNSLGVKHDIIC